MSKFHINLLLQISKALVNSKNPIFNSEIPFFLNFGPTNLAAHPTSGPASSLPSLPPQAETAPTGPPSPRVGRVFTGICFPFWFAPSERAAYPSSLCQSGHGCQLHPPPPATRARLRRHRSPATERRLAPRLGCHRTVTTSPSFSSLNSPLKPSPVFNGVKAINTGVNPPATPPRRSPDPYKRRSPPPEFTTPFPASLRFSPCSSLPLTERHRLQFCTAIARPPRRRPSPGEALVELPTRSSPCRAPTGELWCTRAVGGRAPVSTPLRPGPPSVRAAVGPRWTEHARPVHGRVDPVLDLSTEKINP
jgi:hypothetical protein